MEILITTTGLVVIGIIAFTIIFRVPINYLGLPESIFSGRFKAQEPTSSGWRELIHPPYREGLGFKFPWWKIILIPQCVFTRKIEKREYQTTTSSVFISGLVEWRYSERALFRVVETKNSIDAGLDALIDDFLSKEAGDVDAETCVTRKGELNIRLRNKLTAESNIILPNGDTLSESEKKYGIEILTVHISLVEPPPELLEARNERQKEEYEKQSQTTERVVLAEDLDLFIGKGVNPNLAAKLAFQRQDKLPKTMTDERIDIDAPDGLTAMAGGLLSKLSKSNKE